MSNFYDSPFGVLYLIPRIYKSVFVSDKLSFSTLLLSNIDAAKLKAIKKKELIFFFVFKFFLTRCIHCSQQFVSINMKFYIKIPLSYESEKPRIKTKFITNNNEYKQ